MFDAQTGSTCVLKPIRSRVYWKIRKTKKPKHSTSTACSFPGRITRKEPRHELLKHGARSPRGSREGRSGTDSKDVRGDGLSQPAKVIRRVDSSMLVRGVSCICLKAPKRKKKVHVDGRSWGLCRQLAEMCCATCWQSAERTSLMGGARAVPLRSGL